MRTPIPLTAATTGNTPSNTIAKPTIPTPIGFISNPKVGYPWSVTNIYAPVYFSFNVPATAVPVEWNGQINFYQDGMLIFAQELVFTMKLLFTLGNEFWGGSGLLNIDLTNNPIELFSGSSLLFDFAIMNPTTNTIVIPTVFLNSLNLTPVAGNGAITYEQES